MPTPSAWRGHGARAGEEEPDRLGTAGEELVWDLVAGGEARGPGPVRDGEPDQLLEGLGRQSQCLALCAPGIDESFGVLEQLCGARLQLVRDAAGAGDVAVM